MQRNYIYGELQHYGVKGMRWGVRKDRSQGSGAKKQTTSNEAANDSGKQRITAKVKNKVKKTAKKAVSKENVTKTVIKGAKVTSKILEASILDDVFYGGAGKKIAKETIKQTGRAAVTAYTMARGGYDIRWYDK